jgi:hypothetical protein
MYLTMLIHIQVIIMFWMCVTAMCIIVIASSNLPLNDNIIRANYLKWRKYYRIIRRRNAPMPNRNTKDAAKTQQYGYKYI